MKAKKALRKSPQDVRGEKAASIEARRKRAEEAEAYQVKYKADALARREKLAAEAAPKAVQP